MYINDLKKFANKQIYDLDDNDVLDFLIFKDIKNSGRTAVHHKERPHIGTSTFEKCSDKTLCAKRHRAASLRVGIISKLRKGFEDVGRKGAYNTTNLQGDPTREPQLVNRLDSIRCSKEWQGSSPSRQLP